MRILWVKSDFLHPTLRGGQIRTLEIVRRLHARHEIHYTAYSDRSHPEATELAREYCSFAYPITLPIPSQGSARFLLQAVRNLWDPLPLSVARYSSPEMRQMISELRRRVPFDAVVCDFLTMAPNFPDLGSCVLFQHNVESTIWHRHAQHAHNPLRRAYFQSQYRRMFKFERAMCQSAGQTITVSEVDRDLIATQFGGVRLSVVPTGVSVDYFTPRSALPVGDLIFVGAMDWMPNIDGVRYFVTEILPLIRRRVNCSLVIAGRAPTSEILALSDSDSSIRVTGTTPDIRPYLWGSKVAIVPLRIGGGTRLKIYEAMAAGIPIVSTSVGAEGLTVHDGKDILLADGAAVFADRCVELLQNQALRERISSAGLCQAAAFSWDVIAEQFEEVLIRRSAGAGLSASDTMEAQ